MPCTATRPAPPLPALSPPARSVCRQATMALLRSMGRYAGALLLNDTFTRAVFEYMVVPGEALSTERLAAMAPVQLKTL
jgi:hypothetical protein